jgi:hypothetical protein
MVAHGHVLLYSWRGSGWRCLAAQKYTAEGESQDRLRGLWLPQVEGGDWNGGSFVLARGERTSPADPMHVDADLIESPAGHQYLNDARDRQEEEEVERGEVREEGGEVLEL